MRDRMNCADWAREFVGRLSHDGEQSSGPLEECEEEDDAKHLRSESGDRLERRDEKATGNQSRIWTIGLKRND